MIPHTAWSIGKLRWMNLAWKWNFKRLTRPKSGTYYNSNEVTNFRYPIPLQQTRIPDDKSDIKKTNGRKSSHDTNNVTSNATNYHRCIVKMCFHRHVGLYGSFTSSSLFHKRKCAGSRKCFYFCQYPRLHGIKDTRINTCMTHWWNDTDEGKLKSRRKENLSHFHYVHQISWNQTPGS
jgi:hypothetical protein